MLPFFLYLIHLENSNVSVFVLNAQEPLKNLSNPGASGSLFFLTDDDEFIIKTVDHKEAKFLQKLLPGWVNEETGREGKLRAAKDWTNDNLPYYQHRKHYISTCIDGKSYRRWESGFAIALCCTDLFCIWGALLSLSLNRYYMNLIQNPRTLLPKFYGLYCYSSLNKNIRLVIMNNLLPSSVKMHEKYDLKGSTFKRKASKHERDKKEPTLKVGVDW